MLYVAMRSASSTSWRHAKEAFVAARRVEVGPGVKMDWKRSVRKADMSANFLLLQSLCVFLRVVQLVDGGVAYELYKHQRDGILGMEMQLYVES